MTPPFVDLRSDTLTKPTPAMREAIAHAEVGDDVYAEDPLVNELEARAAALLGHEAGLFCPTGSMTNMLGVRVLVAPGQELLCDSMAHVVRAELGGHAVLGQVTTRTWVSERGRFSADQALEMAVPDAGPYFVSTAAIAVENTHNFGGGTVQSIDELKSLRAGAEALGVAVHLDGARLFNAHVATGVPMAEYGAVADTVSICLSKGLGAPIGSVLVASAERIAEARVWRKRYGGGMRQVGVLAAAGLHALEHHVARLADDHARAQRIAAAVAAVAPGVVDVADVETNIVVLDLPGAVGESPAHAVVRRAAEQGVKVGALGARTVRVVTHLDVDDAGATHAADVLAAAVTEVLSRSS